MDNKQELEQKYKYYIWMQLADIKDNNKRLAVFELVISTFSIALDNAVNLANINN